MIFTLSACETALGGADAEGTEIEGMGSIVLHQGAHGVIASLWPVADDSTAWLMRRFYQLRSKDKLDKAAALRSAQTELMHANATQVRAEVRGLPVPLGQNPTAKDAPAQSMGYSHPYYWAPFVLMGNWL